MNTSAKTIFLFGATGQLGQQLLPMLQRVGRVVVWGRHFVDFEKPELLRSVLQAWSGPVPSLMVNASAYTAVDHAEDHIEEAFAVNAHSVRVLAECAAAYGCLLIHYSTDYVFDGRKGEPYYEDDICQPLNIYGYSKREGECWLYDYISDTALVFRTSGLFSAYGENFVRNIWNQTRRKSTLHVVADQYTCPTPVDLLVEVTRQAIEMVFRNERMPCGVFHVSSEDCVSWYDVALYILQYIHERDESLVPVPHSKLIPISVMDCSNQAIRPTYSCLAIKKAQKFFYLDSWDWRPGVRATVDLLL